MIEVDRLTLNHSSYVPLKNNQNDNKNLFEVDFQRLSIYNAAKNLEFEELLDILAQNRPMNFGQWFKEIKRFVGRVELLLNFVLSKYELSKIGESSFCEVFFAKGKDCNAQFAIKIMPLDCESEKTGVVPEPVALSKALHECRVQLALNSLTEQRRYCIPSEYTGFNFSRRFYRLFTSLHSMTILEH